MQNGNVLDDGKSKSRAAEGAASGLVDAVEPLKETRQMFGGNTRPFVPDGDFDMVVHSMDRHLDVRAVTILKGVGDKITNCRIDLLAVGRSGHSLLNRTMHHHPGTIGLLLVAIGRGIYNLPDVADGKVRRHSICRRMLKLSEAEDIADERIHPSRLLLRNREK